MLQTQKDTQINVANSAKEKNQNNYHEDTDTNINCNKNSFIFGECRSKFFLSLFTI